MEVLDAIRNRRSIRGYTPQLIDKGIMQKLLEAANWAPSGHRIYAWRIAVLEQDELIDKVKSFAPGMHAHPSALLIICRDKQKEKEGSDQWEWKSEFQKKAYEQVVKGFISIPQLVDLLSIMDVAMAAQNVCLAATSFGVGSCIISVFHPERIARLLELPSNLTPQLIVSLGYPQNVPAAPPRRSIEDVTIRWFKRTI